MFKIRFLEISCGARGRTSHLAGSPAGGGSWCLQDAQHPGSSLGLRTSMVSLQPLLECLPPTYKCVCSLFPRPPIPHPASGGSLPHGTLTPFMNVCVAFYFQNHLFSHFLKKKKKECAQVSPIFAKISSLSYPVLLLCREDSPAPTPGAP